MRMNFRSIICATDFSDFSNRTIPYGAAIAREFDARLYVCTSRPVGGHHLRRVSADPVGQQLRIQQEAQEHLSKIPGLTG